MKNQTEAPHGCSRQASQRWFEHKLLYSDYCFGGETSRGTFHCRTSDQLRALPGSLSLHFAYCIPFVNTKPNLGSAATDRSNWLFSDQGSAMILSSASLSCRTT
ncbi:hypothetical protein BLOT_005624, partial [Blomia tropicalis]